MKGYINIPQSHNYKQCKHCGSAPIIMQSGDVYIIKCPSDDSHYQTRPGLIDLEDWNFHNNIEDGGEAISVN